MKRFLILAVMTLVLSSCMVPGIYHYAYDLRPYEKEGFLFTPSDYDKEYKAIGFFETVVDEPYGRTYTSKEYLTEAMNAIKELGGDALVHTEIINRYHYKTGQRIGVLVRGYAIKRVK